MKSCLYIFRLEILLLLLPAFNLLAQEEITFNPVPPPTGFHTGSKAGVQDKDGYMWLGSYQVPLRRYDGYKYVSYAHDPLNSNSLAGNWVEALSVDRKGFIWIGTWGYGLDCLDPASNKFKHFRYPNLSSDSVRAILEDSEGILWIGTVNGLDTYDPKSGKFRHFRHDPADAQSISCNQVVKLYEDNKGTIWVGTGSVWKGEGGETGEGGLNRFDKKSQTFIRYLHDPGDSLSLINNKVKAILEDSHGNFWIGTAGDGLHIMNRATGTFKRHRYDPMHPDRLSRPPQKVVRPYADDHITFLIEDAAQAIWIGTFGNGINRYDPKTQKIVHFPNFRDPVSGVQLEIPWWAGNSRDGILWIGYWRGLYRIDPLRKDIPYFSTGVPVVHIHEDRTKVLWLGTAEGLIRRDPTNGAETKFTFDPHNRSSISNNRINAIYEDKPGELWIGTGQGINLFDRKNGKFNRNAFNKWVDTSLLDNGISSLFRDRKGSIWVGIGGEVGEGLIRKDSLRKLVHYRHDPKDTNSLSKGEVYRIYEDSYNNLLIGTREGGLNRFIPQSGKFQHLLKGMNIHSVLQDSEGVLWVATSSGLYMSRDSLYEFVRFNGPNKELSERIIVNGLLEDNKKNLWLNSSLGLCRLDALRKELVIYSRYHDPMFYNGTGTFKGTDGELFFGGGSGYFRFFPDKLVQNKIPPQIVLSEFRLGNKRILPDRGGPFKQPLSELKTFELSHDQNDFGFDFAGIHYQNPQANEHHYKLEGFENTWRRAGSERRADYSRVPPGRYTFRIKVASSDGVWAEKSLALIINLPWWRTWWAYLIYALSFVATIWVCIWYRSRALKMENVLLEQKIVERTKELEKSVEERHQLRQKIESQQALLNERLRISRELHDDIGSTLGSISIYSEVAKNRTEKSENATEVISKIGVASRELIDKMSDIVWSLNQNNDRLEQLQDRMMAFAAMLLTPKTIQYDFDIDEVSRKVQLSGEQQKNIFLIYKEALYNIVKYSNCKTVSIKLFHGKSDFIMTIRDDGKGFEVSERIAGNIVNKGNSLGGNGITNMKARAATINAKLCIESKINEGTTVQLSLSV